MGFDGLVFKSKLLDLFFARLDLECELNKDFYGGNEE